MCVALYQVVKIGTKMTTIITTTATTQGLLGQFSISENSIYSNLLNLKYSVMAMLVEAGRTFTNKFRAVSLRLLLECSSEKFSLA